MNHTIAVFYPFIIDRKSTFCACPIFLQSGALWKHSCSSPLRPMLEPIVTHKTLPSLHSAQLSKAWSLWGSPSVPSFLPWSAADAAAVFQHQTSRRSQAPGWLLTDYRLVISKAPPPLKHPLWFLDLPADGAALWLSSLSGTPTVSSFCISTAQLQRTNSFMTSL